MFRINILFLVFVWLFALPAAAQNNGIVEKFFGAFDGKRTWGTGMPPRAMSVVIKPQGSGFNITWDSKSLKNAQLPTNKPRSIDFMKTSKQGLFLPIEHQNRKDVPTDVNPLKVKLPDEPLIWVRIEADRLSLYAFSRTPDGDKGLEIYHRTLSGDRMKLHFSST